jgi:hypothetical protein
MGNKIFIGVFGLAFALIAILIISCIGGIITEPPKSVAPYKLIDVSDSKLGRLAFILPVGDVCFKDYTCIDGKLILHGSYYIDGFITVYHPEDYIVGSSKPLVLPECVSDKYKVDIR